MREDATLSCLTRLIVVYCVLQLFSQVLQKITYKLQNADNNLNVFG